MFFKKRISKIIPQWSLHPLRFPQFWGTETFFTIKEGVFLPLRLSCKESSTFLTKPLFPQEREDVTALRCSEPLRYKVGGASKPSPGFAEWDRLNCSSLQYRSALVVARMRNIFYSIFDRITSGEVPIRVMAE